MIRRASRTIVTVTAAALVAVAASSCAVSISPEPVVIRNSYDSPQQFLEGVFAADKHAAPSGRRIRGVIVPHHLTAAGTMASGVRMLSGSPPSRIVLVSPDHFDRCPTLLCTANTVFRTHFGDVHASASTAGSLLRSPLVSDKPELFRGEHGVHAVVPFIAHYLPGTTVTPVVVSQKLQWTASAADLAALIAPFIDDDTVLMVSSDFSHYLSLARADAYDDETAKALFAKDLGGIQKLDNPAHSDCPSCLWLLASVMDGKSAYNPSVVLHTNSARILHDEDLPSTTSHFAMVFYANDRLGPADFAVAGDVTVTRTLVAPALPDNVDRFWSGNGVRLVNLEGPLHDGCVPRANPWLFCNQLVVWRGLRDLATHWGTRNNHMLDLGVEGMSETRRLLSAENEIPVDDGFVTIAGGRLLTLTAVINPVDDAAAAELQKSYGNVVNALRTPYEGLTVVMIHAGREYVALSSDAETALYRGLIDAGADAIIAAHSHVPGDMEIYGDKLIFRGLGNFIFDQETGIATSTAKIVRLRKEEGHVLFETYTGHCLRPGQELPGQPASGCLPGLFDQGILAPFTRTPPQHAFQCNQDHRRDGITSAILDPR